MKQSNVMLTSEVFNGSAIVRRFTFKAINTRDNYALLAHFNRQLAASLVSTRDQSAQNQKYDCFECLSPHTAVA